MTTLMNVFFVNDRQKYSKSFPFISILHLFKKCRWEKGIVCPRLFIIWGLTDY